MPPQARHPQRARRAFAVLGLGLGLAWAFACPSGIAAGARDTAAQWPREAPGADSRGPSLAGSDALTPSTQCRHGKPQGGYTLRAADGRVRVQGAYNQGMRTGSFFFWSANGARTAQLPFDADVLSGTLSLWYDGGGTGAPARKLQAAYRSGKRDGITRLWLPDGRLQGEFDYQAGALAAQRAWDEAGAPLPEADARALALRERSETMAFVTRLLGMLAQHPPDCHPPPARLQAASTVAPLT
jgi:hypothetical protein